MLDFTVLRFSTSGGVNHRRTHSHSSIGKVEVGSDIGGSVMPELIELKYGAARVKHRSSVRGIARLQASSGLFEHRIRLRVREIWG
jgi:hypothetical protein